MPDSFNAFLCYSLQDKLAVSNLYKYLVNQGIDVWLTEEKLLPGQERGFEIAKAIRNAKVVIICLSKCSVSEEGYVQKEIKYALDIADEKPDGTIFIIPVRLDDCEVPTRLAKWNWIDLYNDAKYDKLIESLTLRAASLGTKLTAKNNPDLNPVWGGIEFVHVPAGSFIIGRKENTPLAQKAEKNWQRIELPYNFYIGRYPITNEQYTKYIQATQQKNSNWDSSPGFKLPATKIAYNHAQKFCVWMQQKFGEELPTNWQFRLPTENEWEKSARGEFGSEWPWGNEWNLNLCNSMENGEERVTRIGYYSPEGDSPYGAADMAGNVWEWTISLWGEKIDSPDPKYQNFFSDEQKTKEAMHNVCRVLKGGSFQDSYQLVRCASRRGGYPLIGWPGSGFRVAVCPLNTSQ